MPEQKRQPGNCLIKRKGVFYEHTYNNAHNMEAENAMLSSPRNIAEKRFAVFAGTLGLHPLTNAVRGFLFYALC
ncbi:MAG: hypothetical protein BHW58_03785 [Azospirillum sp. 51_20]|nr:MAG: hypothetical protein BHW58_03785 [Azospirillum sp. 51_20]